MDPDRPSWQTRRGTVIARRIGVGEMGVVVPDLLRGLTRTIVVLLLALAGSALTTVPAAVSSMTTRLALTATALYMGGTGHPLTIPGPDPPSYIDRYVTWAYDTYVGPSQLCGPTCVATAVYTPAEFWPDTGLDSMTFDESVAVGLANLDNCLRAQSCTVTDPPYTSTTTRTVSDTDFTVFGYSDSATIASIQKSNLIAHPPSGTVSFVLVSSGNRPNGGILERFVGVRLPILGVTFGGATVTNSPQPTPLSTVDAAYQYDVIADFPTNPLNLLALVNSLIGSAYDHPEFGTGTPTLQGQYQDSTYYMFTADTLPLVRPLEVIPVLGPLLATVLDPPLRVLVETAYDRTINPGAPTPAKYLYFPNPIAAAANFVIALPTGWDNGIAYLTQDPSNRPFGTTPPGPYGVGGPPVYAGAVDPYGPPTPLAGPPPAALQVTAPGDPEVDPSPRPRRGAIRPAPAASTAPGQTRRRTQAVAAPEAADGPSARSAVPNRSAGSSTGPLRSRSWSDQ